MGKRLDPLDEAIERVLKARRDSKEDILEGYIAWLLAEDLKKLKPRFESVVAGKKRRGPLAGTEQWNNKMADYLRCHTRCYEVYGGGPHGGGMSWEDAHAQVADEFSAAGTRLTSDGVKKRRLKVEKLLKSGILTRRVKRA